MSTLPSFHKSPSQFLTSALTLGAGILPLQAALLFSDNFDVNSGNDINVGTGAPRQDGLVGPLNYTANFFGGSQAADYHQQLPNGSVLQLAGDGNLVSTLVSPDFNFIGADQVTVDVDTGVISGFGPGIFTNTAVTIGAAALTSELSSGGFTVKLIQDTFAGNGEFLQVFLPGSAGVPIANLVPLPGGFHTVDLFITGLGDGDAYDGIGDASVGVTINGQTLDQLSPGAPSSFLIPGGFTDNYVTLEGTWAAGTGGLDTHLFDNLSVQGTIIPEPGTALLGSLSLLTLTRRRRHKERLIEN